MFNFRWILILDVQTRSGSDNCFKNRIRIQKYFENLIRIRLRLENRIRNRPKHPDPKPWFQQGTDRLHTGYFAENRGKVSYRISYEIFQQDTKHLAEYSAYTGYEYPAGYRIKRMPDIRSIPMLNDHAHRTGWPIFCVQILYRV